MRIAVVQAVVFGIVFGLLSLLFFPHDSLGVDVARAAIAAVIFALLMWALTSFRRRRADRG